MDLTSVEGPLRVGRDVAWHRVTLNRPEQRNSLTPDLVGALARALADCEADPDARALVIEGGGGYFSSGMDLAAAATDSAVRGAGGEAFVRLLDRFTTAGVVVISVVDGQAAGGGLGLVAASDFVFATPRSQFSLPEGLWGLVPCLVAPYLIRRAGFRLCQRLALSTLAIGAEEAARNGLVDVVEEASPGGSPSRALTTLLSRLRRVQPSSAGETKRYLRSLWMLDDAMIGTAMDKLEQLLGSPEVTRRLRGFADHQRLPWQEQT
jgi:polyketide biosynthesis enoyl-CoA hydratase PksH